MPVDPNLDANADAKKKKQLMLVAVLLVGLLIAVVSQPSGQPQSAAAGAIVTMLPAAEVSPSWNESDAPPPEFTTTRELARLDADQILETKLFFFPTPEQDAEVVADVKPPSKVTIQAIYGSSTLTANSTGQGRQSQHRALIGKSIVQTGEVLPDGREIVNVTPDGVELAQ